MDVVASVVAGSQSAHLTKPTDRAFDDPAMSPQAAAMLRISLRQHRLDSPLSQLVAMRLVVVRPIALHVLGSTVVVDQAYRSPAGWPRPTASVA
jgi:hypothetical protein